MCTYRRCQHCDAALTAVNKLAADARWCLCLPLGDELGTLREATIGEQGKWSDWGFVPRVLVAMQRQWKSRKGGLLDVGFVLRDGRA